MTYRDHPLAEAARYGDAQAEEHGLEQACVQNGMDIDALAHIAEQRALRLVILRHRGAKELAAITSATENTPVRLSANELNDMTILKLAYLDGLFIGWKANEINSNTARQ